ncbi:hypothetical protein GCM10010885_14620 [Alicyclobacillus cellulosilyticus]|uniref:Uncharacterized protein n=1 Tax=Alicyclobacillus cellulosilyticus TaxID=1003997 RepID=A0A917KA09_9BACL|nr:hypothetical protein [Alicyclobacillus cellulosilyticus]GGJ06567.1 hypothetical protein GCM10010885_14620 [Alicyclobacillus cellulosilyticus]
MRRPAQTLAASARQGAGDPGEPRSASLQMTAEDAAGLPPVGLRTLSGACDARELALLHRVLRRR